jgi:hypothetical protein
MNPVAVKVVARGQMIREVMVATLAWVGLGPWETKFE